jgi:hypothetical protein
VPGAIRTIRHFAIRTVSEAKASCMAAQCQNDPSNHEQYQAYPGQQAVGEILG